MGVKTRGCTIILIPLIFLMMASSVFAECWEASGLKGYGSGAAENYNIHKDGITGRKFRVNIDGKNSSITGSDSTKEEYSRASFEQITPQLIVAIYKSGGYKGMVESWGIDVEHRKVYYTQTKSGYTIFDGAKMFVGELEGKCK